MGCGFGKKKKDEDAPAEEGGDGGGGEDGKRHLPLFSKTELWFFD